MYIRYIYIHSNIYNIHNIIYIYNIYIHTVYDQNLHFQYFQLCQRLTGRACHDATLGGAEQLVFYQSSDGQLIFLAPWHHQKRWVSLLSAGVGGYIVYIYNYIYICISCWWIPITSHLVWDDHASEVALVTPRSRIS